MTTVEIGNGRCLLAPNTNPLARGMEMHQYLEIFAAFFARHTKDFYCQYLWNRTPDGSNWCVSALSECVCKPLGWNCSICNCTEYCFFFLATIVMWSYVDLDYRKCTHGFWSSLGMSPVYDDPALLLRNGLSNTCWSYFLEKHFITTVSFGLVTQHWSCAVCMPFVYC